MNYRRIEMEKSALFLGGAILGVVGIATIACLDDKVQSPRVKQDFWSLVDKNTKENLANSIKNGLGKFEEVENVISKLRS